MPVRALAPLLVTASILAPVATTGASAANGVALRTASHSDVKFTDLTARLVRELDALDLAHLEPGYRELCARHRLDPEAPGLRQQYRRARVLFEGVRDGGFWRLRWAVTNRAPTSKEIWKRWREHGLADSGGPSATAECDELSTLYAFLGRSVGVRNLSVFYPTWNHAIAAWAPRDADGKATRVLIPTSQIFLSCEATFDHTTFSPTAQRTLFEYTAADLTPNATLRPTLVSAILTQVMRYGGASESLSALLRLHRAERFGSSVGDCRATRGALVASLAMRRSAADDAALSAYAGELGFTETTPSEVLLALR